MAGGVFDDLGTSTVLVLQKERVRPIRVESIGVEGQISSTVEPACFWKPMCISLALRQCIKLHPNYLSRPRLVKVYAIDCF